MLSDFYTEANAQSIADKIIFVEEAYAKKEYERLSFEDKCRFALNSSSLLPEWESFDDVRYDDILGIIYPELQTRAKSNDSLAIYVLNQINRDVRSTDDEPERDEICEYYHSICNEEIRGNASVCCAVCGDYRAVVHLANCFEGNLDNYSDYFKDSKRKFWAHVQYLVMLHFYRQGYAHLGDSIGRMIAYEEGCSRDLSLLKQIYTDLMFDFSYDPIRLFEMSGVTQKEFGEELSVAEMECRLQLENGRESNFWRLILITLLSGDREKFKIICDELSEKDEDLFARNICKAYRILLQASKKEDSL